MQSLSPLAADTRAHRV